MSMKNLSVTRIKKKKMRSAFLRDRPRKTCIPLSRSRQLISFHISRLYDEIPDEGLLFSESVTLHLNSNSATACQLPTTATCGLSLHCSTSTSLSAVSPARHHTPTHQTDYAITKTGKNDDTFYIKMP